MTLLAFSTLAPTDIAEIDHQHQRILESINTLHFTHVQGTARQMAIVLDDLHDFVQQHLAYEEKLMDENRVLMLDIHQKVNRLFEKKFARMKAHVLAGELDAEEIKASLRRWLTFHINLMNRSN